MLCSILLSTLAASLVTAAPSLNQLLPRSLSLPANAYSLFISAAWYPGWSATDNSFTDNSSDVNWQKYTLISWSFAVTTPDPSVLSLDDSGADHIHDFVQQALDHGTIPGITVGGWSGSRYFSSAVTSQNRSTFVQAVLGVVSQYGFTSVEFDWEYPSQLGVGCNEMSSSDLDNFTAFLKELRAEPAAHGLLISAAVSVTPYLGSDGKPSTNLSDFAAVLDHIAIMNYDINGQWSNTVGPNAPLDDSCTSSNFQTGSATKAIKAWTDAGFPASKILLGVPSYGHSFNVTTSNAVDSSGNLTDHPSFARIGNQSTPDQCGNTQPFPDQLEFSALISQGLLTTNGTPANGVKYRFDNCSQTPFIYDETHQLMISYDDPESFEAKGKFIADNNLLGFSMWDVTGDYQSLLSSAILGGADVTSDCS